MVCERTANRLDGLAKGLGFRVVVLKKGRSRWYSVSVRYPYAKYVQVYASYKAEQIERWLEKECKEMEDVFSKAKKVFGTNQLGGIE